jgi:hypothetical protein
VARDVDANGREGGVFYGRVDDAPRHCHETHGLEVVRAAERLRAGGGTPGAARAASPRPPRPSSRG